MQQLLLQGSSRASILGEATINLADYADALKPSSVSMPLHGSNSGAILHVTVQLLTSKTGFREFEHQRELGERGLQMGTESNKIDESGSNKLSSLEAAVSGQMDKVLSILKFEKGNQMLEDYLKSFKEAIAVFQHARIYDFLSKTLKHMKPIPEITLKSLGDNLDFLGPDISPSMAISIAEGKIDPRTMEAFPSSDTSFTATFHNDKLLKQGMTTTSSQ